MKTVVFAIVALIVLPSMSDAHSNPPAITWDWFNAGEAYKHYAEKGPSDLRIAANYYRKAAVHGNASAAYKLGEMYYKGWCVPKSHMQAYNWYRSAADDGDKYGEFQVGLFYQKGLGVATNLPEAATWYMRSAEQNNEWAYHMLAFMLADGQGIARNESLAIRYFEISLPRTNDHWAKWKLALLIAKKDPERSKMLLRESAAAGNPEAAKALRGKAQ